MPSTVTLQQTYNSIQAGIAFRPLTLGTSDATTSNEPLQTYANDIRQTFLSPPFAWPFNRQRVSFKAVAGATGTVTTVGTAVTKVSGTSFDTTWPAGTNILINGVNYQIASVSSTSALTLSSTAGTQASAVSYALGQDYSPTISGTVTCSGSTVTWATGALFNVLWPVGTSITISGTVYPISSVTSTTVLTVTGTPTTGAFSIGAMADFGWLEQASITGADGNTFQLQFIESVATTDSNVSRPTMISPLLDDNTGTITWRLTPVPDQAYTVNLIYQSAPISFTSDLTATWKPIPDRFNTIYQQGLLASAMEYAQDERSPGEWQKFYQQLAGAAPFLDLKSRSEWVGTMLAPKLQAAQSR
jgi:hypothetical protein